MVQVLGSGTSSIIRDENLRQVNNCHLNFKMGELYKCYATSLELVDRRFIPTRYAKCETYHFYKYIKIS